MLSSGLEKLWEATWCRPRRGAAGCALVQWRELVATIGEPTHGRYADAEGGPEYRGAAARRFARSASTPMWGDDDQHLSDAITAAQGGSRDALTYLYCRYSDPVYRCVRGILRDDYDAEDVTQSVFAKLLSSIRRYEPRGVPFAAWLIRVARNAALDHLRQRRQVPVEEVRDANAAAAEAGAPASASTLRDALRELTDEQCRVVVLRHIGGLTPAEIATCIGSSEASVHGLHHRGRQALRRALIARDAAPSVRRAAPAASSA
jgi:RNA polymerase sigma-70 factor, ECF subfamily